MRRAARWLPPLLCLTLCAGRPAALELPADAERSLVHPGTWSFSIRRTDGPLAIDGFLWHRAQPQLAVRATAGGDRVHALEPTSRQVSRLAGGDARPVAAINGDFYTMQGRGQGATSGLFVRDGELLSMGYGRPAFAILRDGTPLIAEFRTKIVLEGDGVVLEPTRLNNDRGPDQLVLYTPAWGPRTDTNASGVEVPLRWAGRLQPDQTATVTVAGPPEVNQGNRPIPPDVLVLSGHGVRADPLRGLKAGMTLQLKVVTRPESAIQQAVGGGPVLLAKGVRYEPKANEPRHPRTAVGFDDHQVLALTVDGRRPGHSIGVTLPELARLMSSFGCTEALNLDGGGSTTCWVRGSILNRPSDGRERSVANALALVTRSLVGQAARLTIHPDGPLLMAPGSRLEPQIEATDEFLNPLSEDTPVELSVEGEIGRIDGGALVAGAHPASGRLIARAGRAQGAIEVMVVERPATLVPSPSRIELLTGETADVTVTGHDPNGRRVVIDPAVLGWSAPAEVGTIAAGRFTAGPPGALGSVTVSGYGLRTEVPVAVAGPELIEDFELSPGGVFSGYPEGVTGAVERTRGGAATGDWFARLSYHLGDQPASRAAYLRIDRPVGRVLGLRVAVRGDGQRAWLRAAMVDGNGTRSTYTLFQDALPKAWQTVAARLPDGLKPPHVWQSVYVVATDAEAPQDGVVEWDRLEVLRVPGG